MLKHYVRFESPTFGVIGPTIGPVEVSIRVRDSTMVGIRRGYTDLPIAEFRSEMPGGLLRWYLHKLFKDGGPIKYNLSESTVTKFSTQATQT